MLNYCEIDCNNNVINKKKSRSNIISLIINDQFINMYVCICLLLYLQKNYEKIVFV